MSFFFLSTDKKFKCLLCVGIETILHIFTLSKHFMTKKENKKVQHVYIEHKISVIGGSIKLGDDTKFF